MEKIQDFFKQIGERLRNPFLLSFLISWIISNYKVVIGLCWYSLDQLKVDGYTSYLNLVEKETDWCRGFLYPLIGASVYTFGFPYFRRFIVLLYTRINKGQEEKSLKILEGGSVSIKKYLRLREDYKESEKRLTKVIDEDSEFMSQRTDLHNQIEKLKSLLNDKEKEGEEMKGKASDYDEFMKSMDTGILVGDWSGIVVKDNISTLMEFKFYRDLEYVDLTVHQKVFRLSALALMRYRNTVYFEFGIIERKVEKATPVTVVSVYSNLDEFEPAGIVDLFQNRIGNNKGGYYILKLQPDNQNFLMFIHRQVNPFTFTRQIK